MAEQNKLNQADYCEFGNDYLDNNSSYDYKGDYLAAGLEGFARRIFLPSQI